VNKAIYQVRKLIEADAEAFFALRLQGLKDSPSAFGSTYEEEAARGVDFVKERFRTAHKRDNNPIFGAFERDKLGGVVGLFQYEQAKKRHRSMLWGMYVAPTARRSGAGRLLCQAAVDHVRESLKDVEFIDLVVESSNHPAKSLYSSMGFRIYGSQVKALKCGSEYFDEDLMSLPLSREG